MCKRELACWGPGAPLGNAARGGFDRRPATPLHGTCTTLGKGVLALPPLAWAGIPAAPHRAALLAQNMHATRSALALATHYRARSIAVHSSPVSQYRQYACTTTAFAFFLLGLCFFV